MTELLLALNVGSSSLKFCAAASGALEAALLVGAVERVGTDRSQLSLKRPGGTKDVVELGAADHSTALAAVGEAVAAELPGRRMIGVGHRIVHGGGRYSSATKVTPQLLADLEALIPLAPLHQPHGITGVRAAQALFPHATHVACFDTGFHAAKPWVHDAFALPRRFYEQGLRRYGFHGLSCQSVVRTLRRDGYPLDQRKLVIAHLGNGASITAMAGGRSVANSMGFSTLDGLTMGTRCGRIDPGALLHLLRQGLTAEDLEELLYKRSGLIGLSGYSNDMRDLLGSDTVQARETVAFFIARVVEEIGRMAAVIGGLDTVVFCGGIGENAHELREKISNGLVFLPGRNNEGVEFIVVNTKEELEILLETEQQIG